MATAKLTLGLTALLLLLTLSLRGVGLLRPNGGLVAFASGDFQRLDLRMNLLDIAHNRVYPVARQSALDWQPAWSPDGTQLVFESLRGLHLFDLATGQVRQLTQFPSLSPSWSPDGAHIAFSSTELRWDSISSIYQLRSDCESVALCEASLSALVHFGANSRHGRWSPDGTTLLFHAYWEMSGYYLYSSADGTSAPLTDNAYANRAEWSPDGSQIVFTRSPGNSQDIYIITLDSGATEQITTTAASEMQPSWSPDGTRLIFAARTTSGFDLHTIRANGQQRRPLTDFPGDELSPAWQPAP